jgi:hypothetical protein
MQLGARKGKQSAVLFCAFFALGVAMAGYFGPPDGAPSEDAIVRAGVGTDLFNGLARGRQGLVGSLRWAPVPTLLAAPFLRLPGLSLGPFGMSVVAAGSYALLCAFLNSWWASRGVPFCIRLPTLLALYLSPRVRYQIAAGTSTPVFVLLTVLTVCYFLDWWETRELRSLAYLSLVVGLGLATQYQFLLIFLGVLLGVLPRVLMGRSALARSPAQPHEKPEPYAEGTLILFVSPALYLALLWIMANWLIMGNPGFFLRGLPWGQWHWRSWAGLLHDGCEWGACVLPLGVAITGWLGAQVFRRIRLLAGAPALALALLALLWATVPASETRRAGGAVDDIHRVALQLEECDESNTRIAVSGYSGYTLDYVATPRVRRMLVRTLSIYMDPVLRDTLGKALYIAVPPELPEYRWEDIHLKFPRIYDAYHRFVVFERNMEGWRLLGVARTDHPVE